MVSYQDSKQIEYGDRTFSKETLYEVTTTGVSKKVDFEVQGEAGGGFDAYVVNDINEKKFLITFYLRKESYFIDKKTGQAIRTIFMLTEDFTIAGVYRTYVANADQTFYYVDPAFHLFRVDDYLTPTAKQTELPQNVYFEKMYLDKGGDLYLTSGHSLEYYKDNTTHTLTTNNLFISLNHLCIWNDLDGNLNVVGSDGNIYTLLAGVLTNTGTFGTNLLYQEFEPGVFNFPEQNKTLSIFWDGNKNKYRVYDLAQRKPVKDLTSGEDPGFEIVGIDSSDKAIALIRFDDITKKLVTIDASSLAIKETPLVNTSGITGIEWVYVVNDALTIIEVCEEGPARGACYLDLKYMTASGELRELFAGVKGSGNIIKL